MFFLQFTKSALAFYVLASPAYVRHVQLTNKSFMIV